MTALQDEEKRKAEYEIFKLRKQAGLELRVGNVQAFERIQTAIVNLQVTTSAMMGRGKDTDNAGIDY